MIDIGDLYFMYNLGQFWIVTVSAPGDTLSRGHLPLPRKHYGRAKLFESAGARRSGIAS